MYNKIVVLIPAYEPSLKLIDLLKELKQKKIKTIVVNDGSGIEYNSVFGKARKYASVIEHEVNKGKGAALKTGFNYIEATTDGDYVVVTVDCDGQHNVSDAIKLGEYALNNPDMLVLGRRLRSKKTPLRSRFGNATTRFFYRITTGIDVYDTQTGLRAFSNKLISFMLSINGDRFEYEMNMLLSCSQNKIKMKELDIETIYIDNNSHSHFKTIRDSLLIYKELLKFLLSSIFSFIVDYLIYILLVGYTNKIVFSNVIARIFSSILNYNINKRLVFDNKNKKIKQVLGYFSLVILILILNTCILNLLVNICSIDKYIAKVIVEICLFILSWGIQKKIIFNNDNK